MSIREKIKEIQAQPESVRMRWIWGCVAASMLVVVSIWIFSFSFLFQDEKNVDSNNESVEALKSQLKNIKDQAPSIKDYSGLVSGGANSNEGIVNKQDEPQTPGVNNADTQQTTAYENLNSAQ